MVSAFTPATCCDPTYLNNKTILQNWCRVASRTLSAPISNLRAIIGEILAAKLDMVGSGEMIGRVCGAHASTHGGFVVFR
jgi:hypothetical protein